jgi:thiosulfate dehydrogenase [quinone] large subunit
MRLLRNSSPIGGLIGLSLHAPTVVGLAIALGELAVGVGTLVGLFSRLAAIGGALLSLTFFLTVSWNTTPYYYGSDIVFVFAWLTMFAFGTGGVLSVEAWVRSRARASVRLKAGRLSPRAQAELDRRTVVWTGLAAAGVGAATAVTGALTAVLGRALHTPAGQARGLPAPAPTSTAANEPSSPAQSPPHTSAPGTAIGLASSVPVGQARSFTDPATGDPAWVVQPSAGRFVAFDAVCTHAGCAVQYDPTNAQFVCPCHGGAYDARTGQVLQGPPPAPLQRIPLQVVAGQLRVDT